MLYPLTFFVQSSFLSGTLHISAWKLAYILRDEFELRAWFRAHPRIYLNWSSYRVMDGMQDDIDFSLLWRYMDRRASKLMPLPDVGFRAGPMPLKRRAFRAYYRAHYRRIRTQAEIRARGDFDQSRADVRVDYGIDIRGRRRPQLPNIWDDCPRSSPQRSWKKHRRTQYH